MNPIVQLIAAWAGSLGFAMLFNVRGKKLPLASLGGLLAWAVYLLIARHTSNDYLCGFCASVALTLYAEVMAILEKSPVTVFLVSAAIPLIPGAALYRAMDGLMHGKLEGFVQYGRYALLFAASMSAGITVTTILFQLIRSGLRRRFQHTSTDKTA
ncbi:MAG: threonine/serine exporter family protein [Eubacteriales bacterium]|nr:threonine/serine exporter family protein [Eubacteriales bacterium]